MTVCARTRSGRAYPRAKGRAREVAFAANRLVPRGLELPDTSLYGSPQITLEVVLTPRLDTLSNPDETRRIRGTRGPVRDSQNVEEQREEKKSGEREDHVVAAAVHDRLREYPPSEKAGLSHDAEYLRPLSRVWRKRPGSASNRCSVSRGPPLLSTHQRLWRQLERLLAKSLPNASSRARQRSPSSSFFLHTNARKKEREFEKTVFCS